MSLLGKMARISLAAKDSPKTRFGVLNVGANKPDVDFSDFAGKEGEILGYNNGHEYGDGMYDEVLYILQFEVENGKCTLRVPAQYVEVID